MDYYNEWDPYAAQWLRNLIAAGHLPPGEVDERSIEVVSAGDLRGYRQCHFFAGIGGWALALKHAGWPDDREVWTGSCPCQPFSSAGKGDGFNDERHLWPHFQRLIAQRRPAIVLGEQVASKDAEPWIELVQADVEALGYAFGAVPFPAASIGAPHIRDRLYWVADAGSSGLPQRQRVGGILGRAPGADAREAAEPDGVRDSGGLADARRYVEGSQSGDGAEAQGVSQEQRGAEQRADVSDRCGAGHDRRALHGSDGDCSDAAWPGPLHGF